MNVFTLNLWEKEEYSYDTKTDFIPTITGYIQNTKKLKPTILVVPGGGYSNVSSTESEVVALKFLEKGYNAFILTYTTKTSSQFEPVQNQALKDIAKAMVMINANANEWNVDVDKICAIGFSAGGHLVSSLSVHHDKPFLNEIKNGIDIRPKSQILSYPVISMSESFRHQGSTDCLLGENPSNEDKTFWSTEKQVGLHTPPTFLWHCVDDASVSYENSIAFAKALGENKIQFELHIFPFGSHGLSTCDESWVETSYDLNAPTFQIVKKLVEREIIEKDGLYERPEFNMKEIKSYEEFSEKMVSIREFKDVTTSSHKHISKWVSLAIEWLEVIMK